MRRRSRRAGTLKLPRFRLPCGLSVLAGAWQKDHSRAHARCGGDSPFAQHFVRQWTIQTRRWRYRDQHAAAAARRLCRRRHAVRAAIRARDGNTDDTGPRARDGLGQLSRRPACRHRARFGDRGRLLPQRVEVRPAQCGTAQPHLPVRAHRGRYRGGRPPRRPSGAGRSQRSDRAACARRARAQAEAICAGAAEFRAIDPRPGYRSYRHAADGLGLCRRRRFACGSRHARPALRAGLVFDLQGHACRFDPRSRQQQKGRRQTLRARL